MDKRVRKAIEASARAYFAELTARFDNETAADCLLWYCETATNDAGYGTTPGFDIAVTIAPTLGAYR